MRPHADHDRIVFYVDGDNRYHERFGLTEAEGREHALCGVSTRTRGHECTARVAVLMNLQPCAICQARAEVAAKAVTDRRTEAGAER